MTNSSARVPSAFPQMKALPPGLALGCCLPVSPAASLSPCTRAFPHAGTHPCPPEEAPIRSLCLLSWGLELCDREEGGHLSCPARQLSQQLHQHKVPARASAVWAQLALPLQERERADKRLDGLIPCCPAGMEVKAARETPHLLCHTQDSMSEGKESREAGTWRLPSHGPVISQNTEGFVPHWSEPGTNALDN